MEKDMRNFRKRLSAGASVLGAVASQLASAVLASFAAGGRSKRARGLNYWRK